LTARAEIPWSVFLILVITTVGVGAMLIYWIVLLSRIQSANRRHRQGLTRQHSIRDETPKGLIGWMAEAVREHSPGGSVKAKDLGKWAYAWRSQDQQMGVVLKTDCKDRASGGEVPHSNLQFSENF
jgi:hypothetical protein